MSFFQNPGEDRFDSLVAENGFVHDIQLAIEMAMKSQNMSQAELAAALDVSPARISQILADNGKNLRARTIARLAHALRRKPFIEFIDGGADWVAVELVDEGPFDRRAFVGWVKKASEILDAGGEAPNDNAWAPPLMEGFAEQRVAA